jgi:hypothetical protein
MVMIIRGCEKKPEGVGSVTQEASGELRDAFMANWQLR